MSELNSNNRLEELMHMKSITKEKMIERVNLTETTLKSYINGNRNLPVDVAKRIAKEFDVSLDWIYGVSEHSNQYDLMSNIILCLEKVFCFTQSANGSYPSLFIDKHFCEYLKKVQMLRNSKELLGFDAERYQKDLEAIQNDYKEYLYSVFGVAGFIADKAVEIAFAEDLKVADIFANSN